MYTIRIVVHCPDKYVEILPDGLERTICVIEECVALALIEILGTIFVDTVQVTYSSFDERQNITGGLTT